jgi:hypothetical protein
LKLLASAALFPLFSCKKSDLRFPESGGARRAWLSKKCWRKAGEEWQKLARRAVILFLRSKKKADRISLRDDLFEASRADAVGVF